MSVIKVRVGKEMLRNIVVAVFTDQLTERWQGIEMAL